ncbi:hypothetical protein F5X96DRAFT_647508 [Biscogniauxia mediterranea]|nr:hypothetical protein F5X96DRAFT_647508 [Biscogniauxia mediterranea]
MNIYIYLLTYLPTLLTYLLNQHLALFMARELQAVCIHIHTMEEWGTGLLALFFFVCSWDRLWFTWIMLPVWLVPR